jgi:hypothetical protein
VVLCNPGIVILNHNGRNVPPTRQIATTELSRLMTAAVYIAWFGLVGRTGPVIRPRIPVTVCGDPRPAVLGSLNALL